MKILAVLPTFNEGENIQRLIHELFALGILGFGAVVVDDNSPDGTAALAQALVPQYPGLAMLRRIGPAGRGLAGREGFLYALEAGADYVVEMDADFSHQPRHIPELLAAMTDCDLAIGSRAMAGGSDQDRPVWRRLLTRAANFYSRSLLGLPVVDTNSGFRCYSRKALEAIDPASLKSLGPSIVHEVLFRACKAGLRIREIPIAFKDRKEGKSKLNLARLAAGYLWILRLRLAGRA